VGLYVSTTGADASIPELGFTLTHPSTDYDLSAQFSAEDLKGASTLTALIRAGTLVWKKTSGGAVETPTDYDQDFVDVENENTGVGAQADRVVMFKDLTGGTLKIKSGTVAAGSFSGNPKKYAVVFAASFASTSYEVHITGADSRAWSWESKATTGFTINASANQVLTGNVDWTAVYSGETA
jgi:hypothetical protein